MKTGKSLGSESDEVLPSDVGVDLSPKFTIDRSEVSTCSSTPGGLCRPLAREIHTDQV